MTVYHPPTWQAKNKIRRCVQLSESEFKDRLSEILAVDTDEGEIKSCLDLQANGYLTNNAGLIVKVKDGTEFLLSIQTLQKKSKK